MYCVYEYVYGTLKMPNRYYYHLHFLVFSLFFVKAFKSFRHIFSDLISRLFTLLCLEIILLIFLLNWDTQHWTRSSWYHWSVITWKDCPFVWLSPAFHLCRLISFLIFTAAVLFMAYIKLVDSPNPCILFNILLRQVFSSFLYLWKCLWTMKYTNFCSFQYTFALFGPYWSLLKIF